MKRRDFLKASAACGMGLSLTGLAAGVSAEKSAVSKPNIVFIMADDLGFGDLGCYGNPVVQSPNIDTFAQNSQTLTQYYSAGPVCKPTRVSFLTGKYPYKTGSRMTVDGRDPSLDVGFFPKILQQAGYTTKVAGKWHVGHFPGGMDIIGFDEWSVCAPGGWCDYWDYTIHTKGNTEPSNGKYSTDMITESGLEFIERNQDNPFFLYLAYTAPHFPLQAPEEDIDPFRDNSDLEEGTKVVYGMIKRMDHGIGQILAKLKAKGLYDNTMVVFTSDNGPRFGAYKGLSQERYNGHLAGQKSYTLEGGIKVPAIVHWPQKYNCPCSYYPYMMHTVDWFKTLLTVAGADIPQGTDIDGDCYVDYLLNCKKGDDTKRYWSFNNVRPTSKSNSAMRDGDWKLNRPAIESFKRWDQPADLPLPDDIPDYELYRIDKDPFEKNDISDEYPEKTKEMIRDFENWFDAVMKKHRELNS
ncbi:sulfatase-like hydrolase/transferase [Sedimentisphaera salicampi]|uniref:Arylsulfatase n=1 Tax=Sedimentisphaera salicampi TaxID=1941349 RepID=A0A1W6LJ39_9BACT|nr:sulfatase-like hydrolase/transferase [Sedimentisphaera salicampi]ARN55779.1 Arylsulfatase [Sedimentisphaera salicampi]OXU15974.1 Arylsulfatase [Sedimentisphaera salicampi]